MTGVLPPASPLFLREPEVRRGIELMHFGWSRLMAELDPILAAEGLGRAHQRALYFIARQPDVTVGGLLALLGITKQSLSRIVKDLSGRGLIETRAGRDDRRQRLLCLTDAGRDLEAALFAAVRETLSRAYAQAGQGAVTGFWAVLDRIIPVDDHAARQLLMPR